MKHFFFILLVLILAAGCSKAGKVNANKASSISNTVDRGIGPVGEMDIPEQINMAIASEGFILFEKNCQDCHKIYKQKVGPALYGVTFKREPEWIMNMILNPNEMIIKNGAAKSLLMEYFTPMIDNELSINDARAIFEFLRREDKNGIVPESRS